MNERIKQLAEEFAMHTETMTGIETDYVFDLEDLERFAELVRQDEREACAKLCDQKGLIGNLANSCAAAIRARGEK